MKPFGEIDKAKTSRNIEWLRQQFKKETGLDVEAAIRFFERRTGGPGSLRSRLPKKFKNEISGERVTNATTFW